MSTAFRVAEAARWMGAQLLQGSPEVRLRGVSIDTRNLQGGELFVAIRGAVYDAHNFLAEAAGRGARGLVVRADHPLPPELKPELPILAVADTTKALGDLAAGQRAEFSGPLVAITGSNGKTSVKEMCAAIFSVRAACLSNRGNLNNEYGLPLTLLRRSPEHWAVVVEMGMNHRGEIARLAHIAKPTIAVLTNIGSAHVGHLGSLEEIALEKGDLIAALSAQATAILNADDPRALAQASRSAAQVLTFGTSAAAHVRAENIQRRAVQGFAFELCTPEGRIAVEIAGLGRTAISNALAAAAAALAGGLSLAEIQRGLASYQPVAGRMLYRQLPGPIHLIDDTYNANPESAEAALRTLVEVQQSGRAIAVLGDMGELGDNTAQSHHQTGLRAAELGVAKLFALGQYAQEVCRGAQAGGLSPSCTESSDHCEDLTKRVLSELRAGDWILIKGSRSAHMERVVRALETHREQSA